ncbi:MAG TPA: hypothetical protein VI457_12065 [Methylococcaceae bacterium]|nr:hypothetical protein [Methylococcaceae bacterium]
MKDPDENEDPQTPADPFNGWDDEPDDADEPWEDDHEPDYD